MGVEHMPHSGGPVRRFLFRCPRRLSCHSEDAYTSLHVIPRVRSTRGNLMPQNMGLPRQLRCLAMTWGEIAPPVR